MTHVPTTLTDAAQSYLGRLLKNGAVADYLRGSYPDVLDELEGIVRIETVELDNNEMT